MTPKTKSSFFRRDDSKTAPATTTNTEHAPRREPRSFDKAPSRGSDRPFEKSDKPYSKAPSRGGDRPFEKSDKPYSKSLSRGGDRSFDRSDKPYSKSPSRGGDRSFDRSDKPYSKSPNRGGDRPFEKSDKPYSKAPSRGGDRPFEKSDRPYSKSPSRGGDKSPSRGGDRGSDRFVVPERPTERVERAERKTRSNESFSPRTEKPKKSFAAPKTAEVPTVLRLNRFIAQSGICSRREADELIKRGEVMVNDVVTIELGQKIDTTKDVVKYEGKPLTGEKLVYIIMNKPKGYVTTTEDPHAEQTVIDLLKGQVRERVYPVGRLDKNTTGVLLLTNDGDLTRELTHPSFEKRKIYHAFLDRLVEQEHLEQMAQGIELEDGMMAADQVSYVDGNRKEVGVEIHSGRNRIVRRMFEHFEYRVVKLDRVYFAGFTKEGLRRGFWRPLTAREVATLKGGQYK